MVNNAATRHHVEKVLHVITNGVVSRQDAQVSVDLGRASVVVTGAHMDITA